MNILKKIILEELKVEQVVDFESDPSFKQLIGKRVSVIDDAGKEHIGKLTFAGINDIHGQFQVTIDRTPLWPIEPETIKRV